MSVFRLEVDTSNAAFEGSGSELSRILEAVRRRYLRNEDSGVCVDSNGNRVGQWSIRPDGPTRRPRPGTLVPDTVIISRTGETIHLDDPVMRSLTVAIAEDFHQPTPGGAPDIVSAAADALATWQVLRAAGLKAVPCD